MSSQAEKDLKDIWKQFPMLDPSLVSSQPVELDAGVDDDRGHKVGWIHFAGSVNQISASLFQGTLSKLLEKGPEMVVFELNTEGGSVDSGFEMTKAIEAVQVPTICLVDGDALSEGIYLLQACDVRLMTKRSTLLVHEPYIEMRVDTPHLGPALKRQAALTHAWTEHVARRWKKVTPKQMREKIVVGDWYINSDEALDLGAVDGVVNSTREVQESLTNDLTLPGGIKIPKK